MIRYHYFRKHRGEQAWHQFIARMKVWADRHCETEKDLAVALEGVRYELRQAEAPNLAPDKEPLRIVHRDGKMFCACHNLPVKLMSRQVLYLEGCPDQGEPNK